MEDERNERGVQRDFTVYIICYDQYMEMEGKSHVTKIAGKDPQYRNQFTEQSSHLGKFNE